MRQELAERGAEAEAFWAADVDQCGRVRELGETLAAAAARRAEQVVARLAAHHEDLGDRGLAGGDQGADGTGLRAGGERVGGVFHVGAGVQGARRAAEHGGDGEVRVGGVGAGEHEAREVEHVVHWKSPGLR